MILAMAGYDYTSCSLEEREQLALTKTEIIQMLSSVSGRPDVEGCVYVSTCGRGELYLFCGDSVDAVGLLSGEIAARKGGMTFSGPERVTGPENTGLRDTADVTGIFRGRTGRDAADHLFHLACGMRSQIYGEDQILAQLKQSLELAREAHAAGSVLDRLFLGAVSAGKKVKSTVRLTAVPASVADRMTALLEHQTRIAGKNCLVIGNGEIGRLCAAKLLEAGANVTVTVRSCHTKEVVIPVGCRTVDYKDRFLVIPAADVIVSATTSPHLTLPFPMPVDESAGEPDGGAYSRSSEDTGLRGENPLTDGRERWLFDLALPRDIAPEYGGIPTLHLFGLDEVSGFETARGTEQETGKFADAEAAGRAEEILKEAEEEFFRWKDSRATSGQVGRIGVLASDDVTRRVHKRVQKELETGETRRKAGQADHAETAKTVRRLEDIYTDAVEKVVDNLIYDMRDRLTPEQYRAVVDAMEQAAAERNAGVERSHTGGRPPAGSSHPDISDRLNYFPLFLDTRDRTVLIYGAGKVALRRVKKLLEFSCRIRVVAPEAEEELLLLASAYPQRIQYGKKRFEDDMGKDFDDGILFVVAATNDREVNRRIGEICRAADLPVSVADRKEESTCYFPGLAIGTAGPEEAKIVAGISSEGTDPVRTAETVREIKELLNRDD